MLSRFALGLLLLCVTGCDTFSPDPHPAQAQPQARLQSAVPEPRELTADEAQLIQAQACITQGDNATLAPSSAFKLSGDMRPFWIVTGKVQNTCDYALKSVKIRITAYHNGNHETLDTADFTVDDVPPLTARAYRTEVQLMVGKGQPYNWYDQVIAAAK